MVLATICAACAPSLVVNSEGDEWDTDPTDGTCQTINGDCTLRAAIQEANQQGNGAFITFENVNTISPATALPALTGGSIKIRGGGAVTLDGNQPGDCSGFPGLEIFESDYNEIQGLTIVNFGTGIDIDGWGGDAKTNVIGPIVNSDPDPTKRNVIGGNCRGIYIHGPGAFGNSVVGNYIGTYADGSTANPNTYGGIFINNGAHDNLIGTYSGIGISFVDPTEHVAYWKLDETSGNRADSIGANTLADNNTVLAAAGKINDAADFEKANSEFLSVADNPDLSMGASVPMSMTAWVNIESKPAAIMGIAGKNATSAQADQEYSLYWNNTSDRFVFQVTGTGGAVTTISANSFGAPAIGNWYFICVVHDPSNDTIGISVNDGPFNTAAHVTDIKDYTNPFLLGRLFPTASGRYFDGLIDEVGLWKRVLTAQEISSLYDNGNGLAYGMSNPERNVISGNGGYGIYLSNGDTNHISGNLIGTAADGMTPLGNVGGGIYMTGGSTSNMVGVNTAGAGVGNVISANGGGGITIQQSNNNVVAGNIIGADVAGSLDLGNAGIGVRISSNASGNIVGTNGDGSGDDLEGNLISGNSMQGIYSSGNNNSLAGNKIGTNIDGSAALGNDHTGVYVWGDNNRVGTNGDGTSDLLEANIIGANAGYGVNLNSESDFNWVAGNLIGVSSDGQSALGNLGGGIVVGGDDNLIGTNGDGVADLAERNLVSANSASMGGAAGIGIAGDSNVVAGNYVGTNSAGDAGLGNLQYGVSIAGTGNLIGTNGDGIADTTERNLISGSGWMGVMISGGATGNRVSGNYIGTNAAGSAAIPNVAINEGVGAVHIQGGASGNVIGTNGDGVGDAAERNLISGNARRGITIEGQGTNNNTVAGNYIGTDATGTSALGNAQLGVEISNNASGNLIGTDGDGLSDVLEANVISANGAGGIFIIVASNNQIAGNFIGTDKTGTLPLGNGGDGIHIDASNIGSTSGNAIGGTPAKANVIAFNQDDGVEIVGVNVYPLSSPILYNSIFENASLGINLHPGNGFYDVSANDTSDGDSGANNLMNFPVLDTALALTTSITITGDIVDGLSNTNFLIQFFSVPVCDQFAEHGEGQIFLGETIEMTNSSGDVSFLANFAITVTPGHFITATATFGNNTSEFSECVEVLAGSQLSGTGQPPLDFVIVPLRDLNCRYYCTTQSDVADNLLVGLEYAPIGWDPALRFFAFEGPTFGEICFAPPATEGTELMSLQLNNEPITFDQLTLEIVPLLSCPAFSTPTPTIDPDEGDNATETPVPGVPECSDGVDNDGDRLIDYSATGAGDPQCRSASDDDELNP